MQLRFHELVGKRVLAADGEQVGTVQDLVAEPVGDQLRVTALLVGYGALMRRISFKRGLWVRLVPPRRIPWSMVSRIDQYVHLAVDHTLEEPGGDSELVVVAPDEKQVTGW